MSFFSVGGMLLFKFSGFRNEVAWALFFDETSALESSASSNLGSLWLKPLSDYIKFDYNHKNSVEWDVAEMFWGNKKLKRSGCNDGVGCKDAKFTINGVKAQAYELDTERFYGDDNWNLYNLVYSRYVPELSEVGFDEEYDYDVLSKYCTKNPQLKLTVYQCETE